MITTLSSRLSGSLRVLLLMLVAAATVGCGDTREEYVFTGTVGPGANTGALTFVNINNLPADVEELVFDFFTGPNATGDDIFTATSPFANVVTVVGVPVGSNSVLLTGYNADGEPVASIVAPVAVQPGGNRTVDLSQSQVVPITLDTLELSPSNATIGVGETQQYTVSGNFSNGETVGIGGVTFSATGPATIDQNGLATGTGDGTATITATRGDLSDTATLEVEAPVGPDPQVTLDDTTLNYERDTAAVALSPGATFTDTVANLDGGTLTITAGGDTTGVTLDAPNTPDIGTVNGDNTDEITVDLDEGATPAAIQEFLRAVTVSTSGGTASFGPRTFTVTLTDAENNTTSDTRTVNVTGGDPLTLTVGSEPGDDFATIQDAVDDVAANAGAAGSTITVRDGDYSTDGPLGDGVVVIGNDPDLAGLTLRGNNAGVSAGSTPGTRDTDESSVAAFSVDSPNVTIDGFEITGGFVASPNAEVGVWFDDESSGSVVRNSVIDQATAQVAGSRGVITALSNPTNITIENNEIRDWVSGTFLQGVPADRTSGHLVQGNLFDDNGVGSGNDSLENTSFLNNQYLDSTLGEHIGISDVGAGVVINGNSFSSTGDLNLYASPAGTVNAENNWWGQDTGPAAGQVNPDGATLDTTPFLTADPFAP